MSPSQDSRYTPIEEDEKLLGHSEDLNDDRYSVPFDEGRWRRRFFVLLAVSITAVVSLALLSLRLALHRSCSPSPSSFEKSGIVTPYSPANEELGYVNKWLTGDPDTPKFMGKPRPELDEAWHNLLEGTLIRFSEEELQMAGNATSVEHKDGGYVGGLGVSHTLHCLKRIKQYLHPDYYYGHEEQDWDELASHADHCLESLRQAVMCQPDVSVYTLQWTRHSRFKPTVRVPQAHACVDWSGLHGWMKDRASLLEDMVPPPAELYEDKKTDD